MGFKGKQYIWKDRVRHMGLPLSFTRYALSDDRLFFSTGFLSIKDEETVLYRIRDISMKRTLWQRICGVGTITIQSSDKTNPVMVLKNIKHPVQTKELLHTTVEQMKIRRKVRLDEMLDAHCDRPHMEPGDFDDDDLDGDGFPDHCPGHRP